MNGHEYYVCPDDCDNPRCKFCRGGLAACTVCGGAEGSLPSHCPGRKMTSEEQELVYTARLDFDAEGREV